MLKKFIASQTLVSLLTLGGVAFAAPPNFLAVTVAPAERQIAVPEHATQVADNVFDLGTLKDPVSGDPIQGYAIVHYRNGKAKGGGSAKNGASSCYTYIARGIKWRNVENWVLNPAGSGLDAAGALSVFSGGVAKWEDAADGTVNGVAGADILGNGSLTDVNLSAGTYNLANEVEFAPLDPGIIAVTTVWYNLFTKAFVEWDQIYNTAYAWSLSGEELKMDLDNIVTHELGHSVGLGDLYKSVCSNETMYGYADFGEINKRDLNTGDIAGVDKLY